MFNVFKGRLMSDPTVKQGKSGNNFTVFRVATDTQVKENPNDKYMKSFMVDVSAFGKQGEIILQHFHKGSNILVFGTLRDYQINTGNDGKVYLNYYVTMDSFEFIDAKNSNQQSSAATAQVPSMPAPGMQAPGATIPAGVPMPNMAVMSRAQAPAPAPVPAAQGFAPAMDAAMAIPAGLTGAY